MLAELPPYARGLRRAKIAERLAVGECTVYRAVQAPAKICSSTKIASHCSEAADGTKF
jgi:transposase